MSTDADAAKAAAAKREKTLRRIAAALAIADDERAPIGEREAAAERASELMTRHGIEEAQARAARGEAPEGLTIKPYAVSGRDGNGEARGLLVAQVAEAMGCQAIHKEAPAPRPYTVILAGAVSDVDSLCKLLPLILAQAQYAAINTTEPEQRRMRGFLPSFLVGYGATVAERIAARRRPLIDERTNPGAAVVLADRAERLAALIAERFGPLTSTEVSQVSANATAAGRTAGRSADIGDPRMTNGNRHAIGH
jgi:hypothetical protein